jgi:hypothetical protein
VVSHPSAKLFLSPSRTLHSIRPSARVIEARIQERHSLKKRKEPIEDYKTGRVTKPNEEEKLFCEITGNDKMTTHVEENYSQRTTTKKHDLTNDH